MEETMNDIETSPGDNPIIFSDSYVSDAPLTRETATELTRSIRDAAEVMWVLIARAHAGKAWKALGYSSWAEYVQDEFNMSRSRSYQLLDQAKVIAAINSATPDGAEVSVSETSARDLKYVIQEAVPEIKEKTQGLEPEEAVKVTQEIIAKYEAKQSDERGSSQADVETKETDSQATESLTDDASAEPSYLAHDANETTYSEPKPENLDSNYSYTSSNQETAPTPPPNVPEPPVMSQEELADIRKNVNAAHDIYTALSALSSLPDDIESVINIIPAERQQVVSSNLFVAQEKLIEFSAKWQEKHLRDEPDAS
jgi:hypothetical protein